MVGIDPGKQGAVAVVSDEGVVYYLSQQTFTIRTGKGEQRDYNVSAILRTLKEIQQRGDVTAFLERQWARPTGGPVGAFSLGYGYGIWTTALIACELSYYIVSPGEWSNKILKGIPGEGKQRSITAAERLYPSVSTIPAGCRKPHDGLCDALCLASYGKIFLGNEK